MGTTMFILQMICLTLGPLNRKLSYAQHQHILFLLFGTLLKIFFILLFFKAHVAPPTRRAHDNGRVAYARVQAKVGAPTSGACSHGCS
jgi:hypothetical protein